MTIWDGNQEDKTMSLKNEQVFHLKVYDCEHSEQTFIDCLQGNSSLVQVHLIGGKWFVGKILGSDEHTILLSKKRAGNHMIYKTAITTISIFEEKLNGQ